MSDGDGAPILDLRRLEESAGGDPDLVLELVGLYLADSEAKFPVLLEAAGAQELEHMGRVAHGLKGSSASMGCVEAAGAFRALEELGRAGDTAGLAEALERARVAWGRASERLRDLAA
ncbi:MAG: Hpt domain-containing protein [Planctomycetota bacterium]|nr:Hpt domain-containing protein [Planctomycetota bacterium]